MFVLDVVYHHTVKKQMTLVMLDVMGQLDENQIFELNQISCTCFLVFFVVVFFTVCSRCHF